MQDGVAIRFIGNGHVMEERGHSSRKASCVPRCSSPPSWCYPSEGGRTRVFALGAVQATVAHPGPGRVDFRLTMSQMQLSRQS